MPLYDYKCRSCAKVTEVRHGFKESFEGSCPACGGEMARVFNPAGIVFKGSGFYINDSRKSSGGDAPPPAKTDSAPAAPAASAPAPPSASPKSETAA